MSKDTTSLQPFIGDHNTYQWHIALLRRDVVSSRERATKKRRLKFRLSRPPHTLQFLNANFLYFTPVPSHGSNHLHDTTRKCHNGTSHTSASSLWLLHRSENFVSIRNFAPISCNRRTTTRRVMKLDFECTESCSACLNFINPRWRRHV